MEYLNTSHWRKDDKYMPETISRHNFVYLKERTNSDIFNITWMSVNNYTKVVYNNYPEIIIKNFVYNDVCSNELMITLVHERVSNEK